MSTKNCDLAPLDLLEKGQPKKQPFRKRSNPKSIFYKRSNQKDCDLAPPFPKVEGLGSIHQTRISTNKDYHINSFFYHIQIIIVFINSPSRFINTNNIT